MADANSKVPELLIKNCGPAFFRLVWWNHIDPKKRANFSSDLGDVLAASIVRTYEDDSGDSLPKGMRGLAGDLVLAVIEASIGDLGKLLPKFDDVTFERLAKRFVKGRRESPFHEAFASQYEDWTSRIANLSSDLIASLERIHEEYLIWLKTHPDDLAKVHWLAFERLTAEILASHDFEVTLTGQVKNKSSDIIAVDSNALGIKTKYLVECKRHAETNRVGINIVNAVLGAKDRAHTDHALLVTTSTFTRGVLKEASRLSDLRLHLRDGAKVKEWLVDYEFNGNGLWLPQDWELDSHK